MSDLPWVRVGWNVRLRARTGAVFANGDTELVGTVTEVDNESARSFRVDSHLVAYNQVASIRVLQAAT